MDLLLTGRYITAQEALSWGLMNEVVARDQLLDRAFALAARIVANSPGAVSKTKLSVLECLKTGTPEAFARELAIGDTVFGAPDAIEGPRAFLEMRAPVGEKVSVL